MGGKSSLTDPRVRAGTVEIAKLAIAASLGPAGRPHPLRPGEVRLSRQVATNPPPGGGESRIIGLLLPLFIAWATPPAPALTPAPAPVKGAEPLRAQALAVP